MSVTLKEYCETYQTKFAKVVRDALTNVIFLGSDELEFVEVKGRIEARISIMYTMNMFDMRHLFDVFKDVWWTVETTNETYTYQIVFHLNKKWL